jgi:hypothetical protein
MPRSLQIAVDVGLLSHSIDAGSIKSDSRLRDAKLKAQVGSRPCGKPKHNQPGCPVFEREGAFSSQIRITPIVN